MNVRFGTGPSLSSLIDTARGSVQNTTTSVSSGYDNYSNASASSVRNCLISMKSALEAQNRVITTMADRLERVQTQQQALIPKGQTLPSAPGSTPAAKTPAPAPKSPISEAELRQKVDALQEELMRVLGKKGWN